MITIRLVEATSATDRIALRRMFVDMFYEIGQQMSVARVGEIEEEIAMFLDSGDQHQLALFAVDEHDRAVGFALGMPIDEPWARWRPTKQVAYLDQLYVEPESRGAGVGKQLVHAMEADYKALGYTHMALDAVPGKMGYYQRLGYWHSQRAYKLIG